MHLFRTATGAVFALALAACESPPIAWRDAVAAPAGDSGAARLVIDTSGAVSVLPPPPMPRALPNEPMCTGTVRVAWGRGPEVYAAWWTTRADSSDVLRAAYSADSGVTWSASAPADTTDTDHSGCNRRPPSIAVSGDYVHLAYAVRAPEGAGVFFAHSMDHAHLFHSPVAVVYGDRLTSAAVAADGDRVAVAFEDPNSSPPAIGLALSSTMGHIFEVRTTASDGPGAATGPSVAIRGREIAVSWNGAAAGDTATAGARRIVRTGTIR